MSKPIILSFNKNEFLDYTKASFRDMKEILDQMRIDFPRFTVFLNSKPIDYHTYIDFLFNLIGDSDDYIPELCLACTQTAFAFLYEQLFLILKDNEMHLVSSNNTEPLCHIRIYWSALNKSVRWQHTYDVLDSSMNKQRQIYTEQIMNFEISDRVVFKLEFRDGIYDNL